jgi:hypothetical protein
MLLIMHHIALCTTCITLLNYGNLLHIQVDYAKPKMEVQAEQEVQWVLEGPQASSCKDTNIFVIKSSPGASNHYP